LADRGTGTDTLFVSGTEADDSYVVADGAVFGGGLTINFANIESLQVDCKEGNDLVSVLSTSPGLDTILYGNKGSDTFHITPREVEPVTSRNLRGHRGIIEHEISTNDTGYKEVLVEGVAVDILDNDGDFGYVNFVQNQAVYLLFEDDPVRTLNFTGTRWIRSVQIIPQFPFVCSSLLLVRCSFLVATSVSNSDSFWKALC